MNRPTKCVLCFGIVLLVLAVAFAAAAGASSASASSADEFADWSISHVSAIQPPPPPVSYTLTVAALPSGSGSVTKNPNQTVYISGTVVNLTAAPATGYKFDNWAGDASGTSLSTSVTMTGNRSVTANFSQLTCFTLTTGANPSGGGTVNVNTAANCGTMYTAGTSVSLTASPASGYIFSSWTGCDLPSGANCTVTMSGNKSVTANFVACYTLTTFVSPSGTGSVTVNTASNCTGGRYTSVTTVSLTANANSGYTFSSWIGCTPSSGTSCTVAMSTNRSVTANFAAISPTQPTATSAPTATSTPVATSTTSLVATITPLIGGVVATAAPTVTPIPSSALPPTGGSPLLWIASGLVLLLIVIGARALRQSSV